MTSKPKPQTASVFKISFPDNTTKAFQVPTDYNLADLTKFLVKEKLDLGTGCIPEEFQIFSNDDGQYSILDQTKTPFQIAQIRSKPVFMLRRYFYLKDAKKFNPQAQFTPLDNFMLSQWENDYLQSRIIFPMKDIADVSMAILAGRYGRLEAASRGSLNKPMDYLPSWTFEMGSWTKEYRIGIDITTLQGYKLLDPSNFQEIFKQQIEHLWVAFSKNCNQDECMLKGKQKFLEYCYQNEMACQTTCYRTKYQGSQIEDLHGDMYIGISPLGLHFFDVDGMFTKCCYHFQQITDKAIQGKKLIITTDDEYTHTFEGGDIESMILLLDGYEQILTQLGQRENANAENE